MLIRHSLNVSTKSFALVGAALLLLDFASTSVVSAATAATYLSGEVPSLPFPTWVGAVIVILLFTIVSLTGVRESARVALVVLSLHVRTILIFNACLLKSLGVACFHGHIDHCFFHTLGPDWCGATQGKLGAWSLTSLEYEWGCSTNFLWRLPWNARPHWN